MEINKIKIQEIDKSSAEEFIKKFHYSATMPRINKLFIGGYIGEDLVGVMTCGWGTQPKATIKKLFPSLDTIDYWEIGKFCMDDIMPKNSESNFLSKCIKHLKKYHKQIKVLYTWSDGMLGKPGYIYQSSNFLYGGFIWTDSFFTKEGIRIHPRSCKELLIENAKMVGKEKLFWMTKEFEELKGIMRYKGNQLRYCYFLCSKGEKKRLIKESSFKWTTNYPLKDNLMWKIRSGKDWIFSTAPKYVQTLNAKEVSREKYLVSNKESLGQFQDFAPNSSIKQEIKLKEKQLVYLEKEAIKERHPSSMVNPDSLIEIVKEELNELKEEYKKVYMRFDDCNYCHGLDTWEGDEPEEINKELDKIQIKIDEINSHLTVSTKETKQ